jgi:hypothetical protein
MVMEDKMILFPDWIVWACCIIFVFFAIVFAMAFKAVKSLFSGENYSPLELSHLDKENKKIIFDVWNEKQKSKRTK